MRRSVVPLAVLAAVSGCVAYPWARRDPLSAGTARMLLEKNKTTKMEVLEAFGGPNVIAGDGDGNETWSYDRMSYVSASQEGGAAASGAGTLGSGIGFGMIWARASGSSSSSRTMTLFLYFKDDVLVDYKYRSTIY